MMVKGLVRKCEKKTERVDVISQYWTLLLLTMNEGEGKLR